MYIMQGSLDGRNKTFSFNIIFITVSSNIIVYPSQCMWTRNLCQIRWGSHGNVYDCNVRWTSSKKIEYEV